MQANDQKAASNALKLLDQAYDAILKSDYAALPDLSARLEQALDTGAATLGEEVLRRIRQKASRNAVVLLAAQRGIRSARRRLEEVREAASGLTTYDRQGKRAAVSETRQLAQRL